MNINERFERKPFADLESGALFVGLIGHEDVVRAIKAYIPTDQGGQNDFFVTVGPFDIDSGSFPALYDQTALYDNAVLKLQGGYKISPSLSPGDITSDMPLGGAAHGVLLILAQNQILMSVADIGAIGRVLQCWLDVKTGEILPPLKHADYIVTRRWRITAPVENAAPETIFEFNAETERA